MPRVRNDYRHARLNIIGKPKLYVIAAEGDKTEYHYFKSLVTTYKEEFGKKNLHVELLERPVEEAGNSAPEYVEKMLDVFLENHKDYDFQEYDELWLIVDTDQYDNRQEILKALALKCGEKSPYHLGLSNPCFEIWLILHFADPDDKVGTYMKNHGDDKSIEEYIISRHINKRAGICKQIFSIIHKNPHDLYKKLIPDIPLAIMRAKKLDNCDPANSGYSGKICTTIYKLLEKLTNHVS